MFGIIVVSEKLPGNDTLAATVVCTILLSVMAHGIARIRLRGAWALHGRSV